MRGEKGGMIRHLALFLLAASTPLGAAPLGRSFTITSFDRIRVEGPYAVSLSVGRAPAARAEGDAAQMDALDLRVEGRTLIVRQRSGERPSGSGGVRISVATPDLRTAILVGAGTLTIDRLRGLSVDLALQGPGSLDVRDVTADRVTASAFGSGALTLAGKAKQLGLIARGTPLVATGSLIADELTIAAEGSPEVTATARSQANVQAIGTAQVKLAGNPACTLRVTGSANVEGCAPKR